jgi:Na+-transporting methylmalonyl-CoA/oxaloacetate decarboxylase gamma subunit
VIGLTVSEALLVLLFGILVVFACLIALFLIVVLFSVAVKRLEKGKPQAETIGEGYEEDGFETAVSPAGEIKIKGVDEETVAVIIAIVSEKMKIKPDDLKVRYIKALN